jgi:hypothetical protein
MPIASLCARRFKRSTARAKAPQSAQRPSRARHAAPGKGKGRRAGAPRPRSTGNGRRGQPQQRNKVAQTARKLFAGSAPSAMRDIFTRHDQPFFNQADLVEIGPLDLAAVHGIIDAGFTATGRLAGGVAGRIFALTGGHPQRTMRAADQVWRRTPPGGDAEEHWGGALLELRRAEASSLAAAFDELAVDERKVLRVIASGGSLFGVSAKRVELSAGGARHARDALLSDGKLHHVDDALAVTDPLLADWLRDTLPA